MTNEEVSEKLSLARKADGTIDFNVISELNEQGIHITFTQQGIRWQGTSEQQA